MSNNTGDAANDLDFASGSCAAEGPVPMLMTFAAMAGKRLDGGWSPGAGGGLRNSAVAIANTTYHIFGACKENGVDPDYYAHTSTNLATVLAALQAESGGSSYLYLRRIGSILRVSAAIVGFKQFGDLFLIATPTMDISISATATTANRTLYALKVPLGLQVEALFSATLLHATAGNTIKITSPEHADISAGSVFELCIQTGNQYAGGQFRFLTDTSGRIGMRATNANSYVVAYTEGWIDTRGRLI